MSLTTELLKKSEKLAELTGEQLAAIVELSVNDENVVIGQKTGEIYGNIDRDITEATGLQKPTGVKTYEWLKNTLLPDIKKVKELTTQIGTLKTEKKDLEKIVKDGEGADENLKTQITAKEKKIEDLTKQMKADKLLLETKTKEYEKTNFDLSFNFLSSEAEKNIKFKDTIPQETQPILLKHVKSEILAEYKVDSIDDGKGGKRTVFKKDGVVANNPDNALNPYTLEELYKVKLKGNLEIGKNQKGAGSGEKGAGGGGSTTFDISGAKTQMEADEAISKHLMDNGTARDSDEFQPAADKLREENKVNELPMR